MDPAQALAQLGGSASTTELYAACSRRAVRAALVDGTVVRLRRDVYALPSPHLAVARALSSGAVLSGPSAAMHHGLQLKHAPSRPWLLVPPRARRPPGPLHVRRGAVTAAEAAAGVRSVAGAVADCARWLPFDEALCAADSALRGGVPLADLLDAARALPRTGRSRALAVVRAADGRAANPFESVTRAIALPVPGLQLEPQVHVDGVGRVDLADRRLRIVVECDSYAFHTDPEAFALDLRRHTALVRSGWRLVRVGWRDAMERPAYVRGVLADVVLLAGTSDVRGRRAS
ncbi:hypothetical protein [Nocardioides perillae]|uniref:Very-short-patch-repair endonuclease n=1 Tax=Nocardioides perillae TaxID=1119534 RepID=A0A7Y9RSV8_9ACTN|nr:hypothetical protein [Nocardioides perillae]NYG54739.1 very-short-patch-repair endonuclease [Nocardioides perillae]